MKIRFLTRHDKRHSAAQPKSRRCRARRLAFERCEDRLVLSGSSLTAHVSLTTHVVSELSAGEGGFLAFDSNSFLQTSANDFLLDADSSDQSTNPFGLTAHWLTAYPNSINLGQQISVADFAGDLDRDIQGVDVSDHQTTGSPNAGLPIFSDSRDATASSAISHSTALAGLVGRSFSELDSSGPQFLESLIPSEEIHLVQDDAAKLNVEDSQNEIPPGLGGKTARLLVIDDPVQLAASQSSTLSDDLREGGALEVTVAVTTTQRAYETQLAAVVVHNLNHDGILPVAAPQRLQPVVAELARAVAFETLGRQTAIPADEVEQIPKDLLRQQTQSAPPLLVPVSAQQERARIQHASVGPVFVEESVNSATKKSTRLVRSSANLVERVDDERQATHTTIYAQWPAVAAVIAGYLMVDRDVASTTSVVRVPPRRDQDHGRKRESQ